ncbi:unnamed protein product [Sphagnum jensenii]
MKRGRSERIKYFKAPFREENYSSHHTRMHSTQWAEYHELEASAKKLFFDNGTISGSQTTMHAFAAPRTPQVTQVIMETKEVLGIGSIGLCSEGIVSRYARFIYAMNLQCIVDLLRQC